MDNAQILSAITGQPVDDVRDDMARLEKSIRMGFDFIKELHKVSNNDTEFASLIQAHITMMLNEFTIEAREVLLMRIAKVSISNRIEDSQNLIDKFKENGKKKITNPRRHRQD